MKLNVTNPINWTPKPGIYHGMIEFAGGYRDPMQARIIIALEFEDGSGYDYKVHRVYPAQIYPGSDLHRDIESILGAGHLSRMKEFDLEQLVGTKVVVNIVHIKSKEYRRPLVTYNAIHPAHEVEAHEEEPQFSVPSIANAQEFSGPIEMNLRKLQQPITSRDRRNDAKV